MSRMNDGRKSWKLSPIDLESHRRWYDYSRARDEMFAATNTKLCRRSIQHYQAPMALGDLSLRATDAFDAFGYTGGAGELNFRHSTVF
jgi:hypothetical protein